MQRFSILLGLCLLIQPLVAADSSPHELAPLLESSCIYCHDNSTETPLNLQELGSDLSDAATFRAWEKVFDRIQRGEMPPASEATPDPEHVQAAQEWLASSLSAESKAQQAEFGRVTARRLTKLELGYTLRDLFSIDVDVTRNVPDEVDSGVFDTVGANQRVSAVHMESYLASADQALDAAIQLGKKAETIRMDMADNNWAHLLPWHDKPLNLGGSVTRALKYGKGVALFRDVDYLTQFASVGRPGIYRLSAKVAAYQAQGPIIAKIVVKSPTGNARLVKSMDLLPGKPQLMSVETYIQPGEYPYLTMQDEPPGVFASGGAKHYRGPGLAILSQTTEGPLVDQWPPEGTSRLLADVELAGPAEGPLHISAVENPLAQVRAVVAGFATRALRRPVTDEEMDRFVALARPAVEDGRDFLEVLRIPLRGILSSPQFMLFDTKPGKLDDYALASRLSYFLWRSLPDAELLALAEQGQLTQPEVLSAQVDRLLDDPKSQRFVDDFVGQWLRLNKVNVTTPDDGLYPEFDELLSNAIPQETKLFFASLIDDNLSLDNLIDADFTFLNRRLAEHYGIDGVEGQEFRRVELPPQSIRGGILTQAAILKTTANGTTTSPVMRGNFVLTNFLGTPPASPPPGVGSIEPDTRGQTTIREILAAHREIETCNQCHKEIDPPGFALECFDPIGGFRDNYRTSGGERTAGDFTVKLPPKQGPKVDASGVTSSGESFDGMKQFKQILMRQREQIAHNFVSQLAVYATGAEIQFADREQIQAILDNTRNDDFPIRSLIHQTVLSSLFTHQ